jgi:hypothetical protein
VNNEDLSTYKGKSMLSDPRPAQWDKCSFVDRHRFDTLPDPNFCLDADPYPDPDRHENDGDQKNKKTWRDPWVRFLQPLRSKLTSLRFLWRTGFKISSENNNKRFKARPVLALVDKSFLVK